MHVKSVHDKIRDHTCTTCDYAASDKRYLENHVKYVHYDIKDHKCTQCDYAALRKKTLVKHIKSVYGKDIQYY
jgi:KRAB domain-containing zinc finger protein